MRHQILRCWKEFGVDVAVSRKPKRKSLDKRRTYLINARHPAIEPPIGANRAPTDTIPRACLAPTAASHAHGPHRHSVPGIDIERPTGRAGAAEASGAGGSLRTRRLGNREGEAGKKPPTEDSVLKTSVILRGAKCRKHGGDAGFELPL